MDRNDRGLRKRSFSQAFYANDEHDENETRSRVIPGEIVRDLYHRWSLSSTDSEYACPFKFVAMEPSRYTRNAIASRCKERVTRNNEKADASLWRSARDIAILAHDSRYLSSSRNYFPSAKPQTVLGWTTSDVE